jgi:hypothetical protein
MRNGHGVGFCWLTVGILSVFCRFWDLNYGSHLESAQTTYIECRVGSVIWSVGWSEILKLI